MLKKMSEADQSDLHFFSMTHLILGSLQQWKAPKLYSAKDLYGEDLKNDSPVSEYEMKAMQAFNYSIVMTFPPMQYLTEECQSKNMDAEERVYCQKIAKTLITDKTLLAKLIGVRIGLRAFDQQPEADQWRALFRKTRWQNLPQNRRSTADLDRKMLIENGLSTDENAMLEKQLLQNGVSLNPPDHWQPDDDEYRKMISASADP
ncbi:MAG: hypothetical protein ABIM73_07560 [Arenimonas sp.]